MRFTSEKSATYWLHKRDIVTCFFTLLPLDRTADRSQVDIEAVLVAVSGLIFRGNGRTELILRPCWMFH